MSLGPRKSRVRLFLNAGEETEALAGGDTEIEAYSLGKERTSIVAKDGWGRVSKAQEDVKKEAKATTLDENTIHILGTSN